MTNRNHHIVLLGDSVFDNGRYVRPGEPDVSLQLCQLTGPDNPVTLLARDGAVTREVTAQARLVPSDATHLIVSVGGNDALGYASHINGSEIVRKLAFIKGEFQSEYRTMLDSVTSLDLPTAICTIYRGNFDDPSMQQLAEVGTSVLNDVITYEASARELDLIDLRVLFNRSEDYANPIEPSMIGGEKIAQAINQWRVTNE